MKQHCHHLSEKSLDRLNLVFAHRDNFTYPVGKPLNSTGINAFIESLDYACPCQDYYNLSLLIIMRQE